MNEMTEDREVDDVLISDLLQGLKPSKRETEQIIHDLAQLSELDYGSQRKEKAKELDLQVTLLDSLVKKKRRKMLLEDRGEFVLNDKGLFALDEYNQPGDQLTSPFTIISECRSEQGTDHSLVIAVTSAQGLVTQVIINRRCLAGDGKEALQILLDAGLRITSVDGAQRMLVRYLLSIEAETIQRLVLKPGWHDTIYVTASGQAIPDTETDYVYAGGQDRGLDMAIKGTLEQWRHEIGWLATGNHYVITFIALALASLVLPLLMMGSFIINLVGTSSTGKSTALNVANSTMGSPARLKTWRITSNALEGLAEAFNHAFLPLDEMGQVAPKDVGESAYLISQDQGKGRANKYGDIRAIKSWNLTGGSTGEVTLAEQMRTIGNDSKAGQEVRIIDLQINPETPYGVFHQLNGADNGEDLSNRFQSLCRLCYGAPARAFITQIQSLGFDKVIEQVQELMAEFKAAYLPETAGGQVRRVCERFALLAATGELATRWEITGWQEKHAFTSLGIVFTEWLESRGTYGAQEEKKILARIQLFFEQHGESRFTVLGTEDTYARIVHQRSGYRSEYDGKMDYYVFPETFSSELCAGFNRQLVIEVLTKTGILQPGAKSPSKVVRINEASVRVYHLQNVINYDTSTADEPLYFV